MTKSRLAKLDAIAAQIRAEASPKHVGYHAMVAAFAARGIDLPGDLADIFNDDAAGERNLKSSTDAVNFTGQSVMRLCAGGRLVDRVRTSPRGA